MSTPYLRESRVSEDEIARWWWALPSECILPLSDGRSYQLLFAGQPGGAMGPDVRDAVLCTSMPRLSLVGEKGQQIVHRQQQAGDVEFHIRSSDWRVHQHDADPRYNNVVLHVVLLCDDPLPTTRQDAVVVPVCSLYDLPSLLSASTRAAWPCQDVMQQLSDEERFKLLRRAGLLRFEQKTHIFVEQLHSISLSNRLDSYDICLIPALAEALGYGRNREFFRAVGLYLLDGARGVPEPLGRSAQPAPLDIQRLRVISKLVEQGYSSGVWRMLRNVLQPSVPCSIANLLQALRSVFCDLALSLARTDILICNVVLPFAAAVALLEHDVRLIERAQELYVEHPGLSSNRVIRMMCAQLQLKEVPHGSCQQQGLHYIYQQTCREKHCTVCVMGKKAL